MIFFSEQKLAAKLREGAITRNQTIIYMIIFVAYFAYEYFTSLYDAFTDPELIAVKSQYLAFNVFSQAVNLGVVFYAFKINSKGDARDFAVRYISLAIPIGVKAIALTVFLFLPLFFYGFSHYFSTHPDWRSELNKPGMSMFDMWRLIFGGSIWTDFIGLHIILAALWAWRLNISFKIVSGQATVSNG